MPISFVLGYEGLFIVGDSLDLDTKMAPSINAFKSKLKEK